MSTPTNRAATASTMHSILRTMSRIQDDLVALESAGTPNWPPSFTTVLGHRAAAAALRAKADLAA